jgi:hypothetical protein
MTMHHRGLRLLALEKYLAESGVPDSDLRVDSLNIAILVIGRLVGAMSNCLFEDCWAGAPTNAGQSTCQGSP